MGGDTSGVGDAANAGDDTDYAADLRAT